MLMLGDYGLRHPEGPLGAAVDLKLGKAVWVESVQQLLQALAEQQRLESYNGEPSSAKWYHCLSPGGATCSGH